MPAARIWCSVACHLVKALANTMNEEHDVRVDVQQKCLVMNRLWELRRSRRFAAKATIEKAKDLCVHALLVQCPGDARMKNTIDAPRQIQSSPRRARVIRALREGNDERMSPILLLVPPKTGRERETICCARTPRREPRGPS